eukprot:s1804_g1.t4
MCSRSKPLSVCCHFGRWIRVTWGQAQYGCGSGVVQDQLKNVQRIQATRVTTEHEVAAVATIHCNGSVVTRGDVDSCGDSSAVQDQLKNVQRIQATQSSFAASIGDGSVVTWGDAQYGGDSSAVQDLLNNVQQIQASLAADRLKTVQQIQASFRAFAAILEDGSVATWAYATA